MASNSETKLFVEFKPHKEKKLRNGKKSKPPQAIDIKNGHYHRKFEAKDAPFAVEDDAELQMLLESGHFVQHKPQQEKPAEETTTHEQQNAEEEKSAEEVKEPAGSEPRRTKK